MMEIDRVRVERHALERAAAAIERKAGNKVYMQAWKLAAKIVRAMKPEFEDVSKSLNDKPEQISTTSQSAG